MHRVYMHVERFTESFRVSFLAADLKSQVRESWHTNSEEQLLDMFERGAADKTLAERQAFELAIKNGRGACWLKLGDDQYRKLCGR